MKSVNPMMVVAVLLWVVCGAAWAGGSIEFSGGGGSFTGGTVSNAVVLTGDNASGTGTLRIRPSDEDAQLVLCEASNNAATEVCSALQHYNGSATVSGFSFTANGYVDSAFTQTRNNTAFGSVVLNGSSSSTAAFNFLVMNAYGTGGAIAGNAGLVVSGAATSSFVTGTLGTVTNDFRGPILNGGSANCNGIATTAGNVCFTDDAAFIGSGDQIMRAGSTSASGLAYFQMLTSAGASAGSFGYGNASYAADADYADKVFWSGVSKQMRVIRTDDVAAGTVMTDWSDNATAGTAVVLMDLLGNGTVRPLLYGSQSNCSDGAGAAACSAAPAGSVVIDAAATTVVVSTTAVTANSQIFVQEDSSLGTKLGVTCNTTYTRDYYVTARTAATSFTITASAAPVTNPACLSYSILN